MRGAFLSFLLVFLLLGMLACSYQREVIVEKCCKAQTKVEIGECRFCPHCGSEIVRDPVGDFPITYRTCYVPCCKRRVVETTNVMK